jgi:hypothetical protein
MAPLCSRLYVPKRLGNPARHLISIDMFSRIGEPYAGHSRGFVPM